jgi:hypothetical protein
MSRLFSPAFLLVAVVTTAQVFANDGELNDRNAVNGRVEAAEEAPEAKRLLFIVAFRESQPDGEGKVTSVKVLSQPRVVAHENQRFNLTVTQDIAELEKQVGADLPPPGHVVDGLFNLTAEGRIRLDVTVATNTLVGPPSHDRVEVHTDTNRTIATIRIGQTLKLKMGKSEAGFERWVDLISHELTP